MADSYENTEITVGNLALLPILSFVRPRADSLPIHVLNNNLTTTKCRHLVFLSVLPQSPYSLFLYDSLLPEALQYVEANPSSAPTSSFVGKVVV